MISMCSRPQLFVRERINPRKEVVHLVRTTLRSSVSDFCILPKSEHSREQQHLVLSRTGGVVAGDSGTLSGENANAETGELDDASADIVF